jgi:MFS family permease
MPVTRSPEARRSVVCYAVSAVGLAIVPAALPVLTSGGHEVFGDTISTMSGSEPEGDSAVGSATGIGIVRSARSPTFAALDHAGFRRYYIGQGISLVGTWLQAAAVRWLVFDQTGSEFMLGVVEVASLTPGILVGLYAGALADRVIPVRMIVLMEFGQMMLAFLLALLVGLGVVQTWQMIVILALARICVTFELPSRQVFFYDLVGAEILSNAIALNSGLFNATRVLGPALAGVCLSALGATGCFALNGVSYLAAIAAVLSIRLRHHERPLHRDAFTIREILGGLHYLFDDRRMFAQFALVAFFGVVGMGYEAMVPAYARRVVGTGVYGYSILLAAGGIGATVGAFAVASLGNLGRKELLTIAGMVMFGGFLAGAALLPSWLPAGIAPGIRLSVASACLLGAGFGAVLLYASSQTIIQLAVPDALRGRVMGIWMITYSSSVPLGALWTGRAAQSLGVAPVMGLSAFLCVATACVAWASGFLANPRVVSFGPVNVPPGDDPPLPMDAPGGPL